MKKKIIYILVVMILMVSLMACFSACDKGVESGTNLLTNSNFEQKVEGSSKISDWVVSDSGSVSFAANTRDDSYDPKFGEYYVKVSLSNAGYAYVSQKVQLEKNAKYRISADVKVDSIVETKGIGVRLGFDTDSNFDGCNVVDNTDGEWTNVTYYFTSATNKEVKFVAGIGSSQTQTSGTAYIDNIVLEKVTEIPASYLEGDTKIEVLKYTEDYSLSNAGSITFVVLLTIVSVLMIIAILILIKKAMASDGMVNVKLEAGEQETNGKNATWEKMKKALTSNFAYFMYVLCGAFIIRFIITICSNGMSSVILDLENIASQGAKNGLLSFYVTNEKATMPMGVVVIYTLFGYLASAMKIKVASLGFSILMRLPLVIADIVIVYAIYSFTAKHKGEKQAAVYAGIYAFLPIFFFYSSFYGAVELLAVAFLVLTMLSLLDKDYVMTSLLYMFSIMFSNYALVILPIILVFEVYGIIKDEKSRMAIIISMVVSFVLFFVFAMLLTWSSFIKGQVFEYFKRMYKFFQDSNYLSEDSFNIYAIFGAGTSKTRSKLIEVLNWLFVAAMSAWPAFLYIKNKNRSDLVMYSGLMLMAFGALGACSTPVIVPMGLSLLLLALIITPENRLFLGFGTIASLSFLNLAQLASQSGYISNIDGASYKAFASNSAFVIVFSIIEIAILFYTIYVSIDIAYYNQASEIKPMTNSLSEEMKTFFKQLFKKEKNVDKKTIKNK